MRKIDENFRQETISDLQELLTIIEKSEETFVEERQELILTAIWLLIHPGFREIVDFLKSNIIPKLNSKGYSCYKNYKRIFDEAIIKTCKALKIDPVTYHSFFISKIFRNKITLPEPSRKMTRNNSEYTHKTRLLLDFAGTNETETNKGRGLYLQIFTDSTPNKLIEYIKKNKKQIAIAQKLVKKYPYPRNFQYFKRDVIALIYNLLGMPYLEIEETMSIKRFWTDNIKSAIANLNKSLDKIGK